jgi:hypothetical protein
VARNLEAFLNRRADKVSGLLDEGIDAAIDEARGVLVGSDVAILDFLRGRR